MILNRLIFTAYNRKGENSSLPLDCKLANRVPTHFSIPPPMQSHYAVEMEE